MSIDFSHCLRRHFTENILTPLLKGTSVNVVKNRGQTTFIFRTISRYN